MVNRKLIIASCQLGVLDLQCLSCVILTTLGSLCWWKSLKIVDFYSPVFLPWKTWMSYYGKPWKFEGHLIQIYTGVYLYQEFTCGLCYETCSWRDTCAIIKESHRRSHGISLRMLPCQHLFLCLFGRLNSVMRHHALEFRGVSSIRNADLSAIPHTGNVWHGPYGMPLWDCMLHSISLNFPCFEWASLTQWPKLLQIGISTEICFRPLKRMKSWLPGSWHSFWSISCAVDYDSLWPPIFCQPSFSERDGWSLSQDICPYVFLGFVYGTVSFHYQA